MKKFIVAFIFLVFLQNCSAQSGWIQINSLPPSGYFHCMEFANETTGFIGSDTCMYRTTNGGINWLRISNHHFLSIQFINSQTGFALFDANSGFENNFLKTTNTGQNWFSTISNSLENTYMIDSSYGYTRFYTTFNLYRTTNGALSWTNSNSNFQYEDPLFFMEHSIGLTLSYFWIKPVGYFEIVRTDDGGFDWNPVYTSQATRVNSKFFKVFTNGGTGAGYIVYAGSSTGYILRSNDTGLTWQILNTGFNSNTYSSIYFTNENTGFASGGYSSNGSIIKTTNAGQSWFNSFNFTGGLMSYVTFTDSLTGYLLSSNGKVFKTINGGVTDLGQSHNEFPSEFKLHQNYPNPFNPTTNIRYSIPEETGRDLSVSLKVYDVIGKEIETLVNENQTAGSYSVSFNAANYPSGVYFYKLETNSFSETKKMILIK